MMVIFQSQAQECVYESLTLGGIEQGILQYLAVAQEASMVSHSFRHRPSKAKFVCVKLLLFSYPSVDTCFVCSKEPSH